MFKLKIDDNEISYGGKDHILDRIQDKKWSFKNEMILSYFESKICVIERFYKGYEWYEGEHGGDEDYVITKYLPDDIMQEVIDILTVCDYLEFGNKVVTSHS